MPELPEVETVTNSVKKHLLNKKFTSLAINWKKLFKIFQFPISTKESKTKK